MNGLVSHSSAKQVGSFLTDSRLGLFENAVDRRGCSVSAGMWTRGGGGLGITLQIGGLVSSGF